MSEVVHDHTKLSKRQRDYLALISFRFRRQWFHVASAEEQKWIADRRMTLGAARMSGRVPAKK